MVFDLEELSYRESYRLLVNTVVPRPIALVTSLDARGTANAAPFSFFNVMGHDPPVLVLGIERRGPGVPKDTLRNITERGEFVVNLVNEAIAEAMNVCAVDFPPDVDELERAGLTAAPSAKVSVPRVLESPVSLECATREVLQLGEERRLVVGDVKALHVADEYYDPEKGYVLTERLGLIGRMHGRGWYVRTTDLFYMERKQLEE